MDEDKDGRVWCLGFLLCPSVSTASHTGSSSTTMCPSWRHRQEAAGVRGAEVVICWAFNPQVFHEGHQPTAYIIAAILGSGMSGAALSNSLSNECITACQGCSDINIQVRHHILHDNISLPLFS